MYSYSALLFYFLLVSKNIEDHKFKEFKDPKSFKSYLGQTSAPAVAAPKKKIKPNDKCPCGSAKKYKKCCRK